MPDSQPLPFSADSIVDTVREPMLVLNADLRVRRANRSFYRTFRVTPEETVGRLIYDLGDQQWDIPWLRKLLEEVLPKDGSAFDDFKRLTTSSSGPSGARSCCSTPAASCEKGHTWLRVHPARHRGHDRAPPGGRGQAGDPSPPAILRSCRTLRTTPSSRWTSTGTSPPGDAGRPGADHLAWPPSPRFLAGTSPSSSPPKIRKPESRTRNSGRREKSVVRRTSGGTCGRTAAASGRGHRDAAGVRPPGQPHRLPRNPAGHDRSEAGGGGGAGGRPPQGQFSGDVGARTSQPDASATACNCCGWRPGEPEARHGSRPVR